MGLYLGNISNYNSNKGYITLELNEPIAIGDNISIEGETGNYTVSEIIKNNENLKRAEFKSVVKLGRMKGNIKIGSRVYKTSSKTLVDSCKQTYLENANLKKIPISLSIYIKKDLPITVKIKANTPPFYTNVRSEYISKIVPETSINNPVSQDKIIAQFSKLGNTPYEISNMKVDLDDNLYVNVGILNEIRRTSISKLTETVMNLNRVSNKISLPVNTNAHLENNNEPAISVLLQTINLDYDYSALAGFNNIYIPLKHLANKKYHEILKDLSSKFNMYVYMPTIIKANYKNLMLNSLDEIIEMYNIKGFVVSNIAGIQFLKKYINSKKYRFIANYTMNIFNTHTVEELKNIGITKVTPSIEASENLLQNIIKNSVLDTELIAYGSAILMNSSYCLLGKTNKCYPECKTRCKSNNKYYLKDRLGIYFRVLPDNVQTVTSIYNSKITSISTSNFNVSSLRIDIIDESISEINKIVSIVKSRKKLEGKQYTNGNLNREV